VKVGDFVKYDTVPYEFSETVVKFGIILQISRTGHQTKSAQIVLMCGKTEWIDTNKLEIINENR
jgi:hypothetical protein